MDDHIPKLTRRAAILTGAAGVLHPVRSLAAPEVNVVFDGDSVARGAGAEPGQAPGEQLNWRTTTPC